MRGWLLMLIGVSLGMHVQARSDWFTVTGNPQDAAVDTVQVDPVAVTTSAESRTMNVRVSRSAERLNWERLPYRSYESQVVFNCRAKKAVYVRASFYMQPLWQGASHRTTDYVDNPRPMLFKDVEPNPTARIIRAACRMTA